MRVRKVNSDGVKIHDSVQVKLKTAGTTQVVQFTAGNNKSCPVRNLSKDKYLDKKTGEVKSKKKSESRYQSPKDFLFLTDYAIIISVNSHGDVIGLTDNNGTLTEIIMVRLLKD